MSTIMSTSMGITIRVLQLNGAFSLASTSNLGSSLHAAAAAVRNNARRGAHSSASVARQESHVHDNDPDVIEKEKERSLRGRTPTFVPSAPGWNQNLASDSESVIKAVQMDAAHGAMTVEEMQNHTIKIVQELHPHDGGRADVAYGPDLTGKHPHLKENLEYTKQYRVPEGSESGH